MSRPNDLVQLRYAVYEELQEDICDFPACRLWFVEAGSAVVSIGATVVTFIGPACLCLNGSEALRVRQSGKGRFHHLVFLPTTINPAFTPESLASGPEHFSPASALDLFWLQTFLVRSEGFSSHLVLAPSVACRMAGILANLKQELESKPDGFWMCRSRSFLFELLHLLNGVCRKPFPWLHAPIGTNDELVIGVLQFINEYFDRKVTIEMLTRRFNTNRTTLSLRFRAGTGMTIMDWLTRTRIQLACLLLRDTTLPVAEIMNRVGIRDITHFGRVFRRETGLSPTAYRQRAADH